MLSNMSHHNEDIGTMALEDFNLWSTRAFRLYLSVRGKSTAGSTDTLPAR